MLSSEFQSYRRSYPNISPEQLSQWANPDKTSPRDSLIRTAPTSIWVRRATVAHELGHLLFDPVQLDRVRVDTYQSNEIDPESHLTPRPDVVEQRANAFSIACSDATGGLGHPHHFEPRLRHQLHRSSLRCFQRSLSQYELPPDRASCDPSDEQKRRGELYARLLPY